MLATLLKPLIPSIYRWVIYGAVIAAILATVAGKAYLAGDDHGQGLVRAADAKAQAAVYARFEWNVKNGQRLDGLLLAANQISLHYFGQIKKDTSDDTHPIVAAPGASTALPLLTAHAVSLWDRAWSGGGLSGGSAAGGLDAGSGPSAADAEGASGFDIRDALYSNSVEAAWCSDRIRVLRGLQQYERDKAAHAAHH